MRISRPMALAIAAGAILGVSGPAASPAEAAAPVDGPPVRLVPQNVPQVPPGQGQLVVSAEGTVPGSKVTLRPDFGLRSQKWRMRFTSGSVTQIVNDQSGLCLRGGLNGNVVRLAICADPNDLQPTVVEQRQFWSDRQRVFNGVLVHRFENVQNNLVMSVRDGGTAPGTLIETAPLNGSLSPSQLYRLQ
ncbi:RICIN domain-containing protein [Nonomuraea sp. NPDC049480]|uniref:RICIN domain-containing protein n=1 Tax=Nonomuraea sp. NPDC049480 TaxID=3364353 RepID=UPI0037901DB5